MRLVGRSEYHLIRGILRVVPLLGSHQISRFDGKCIDQGGFGVPEITQGILNEPVNRADMGFDIAGTGESTIPLSVKGDELVLGIVNEARKLGNGKVAHLGFSFGGNFSAMTGLSGAVDAAIVLGGPVDKAWGKENAQNLPFGMPGIIGNDMGFDKEPSLPEFMAAVQQFSRR